MSWVYRRPPDWKSAKARLLPLLGAAAGLTLALSGVAATGLAGTVVPGTTLAPTGVSSSGAAGSIAPSQALSGNAAAGSAGTLTADRILVLTGVSAPASVGAAGPASSVALSGVLGTGAAGTAASAQALGLTGNAGGGLGWIGRSQHCHSADRECGHGKRWNDYGFHRRQPDVASYRSCGDGIGRDSRSLSFAGPYRQRRKWQCRFVGFRFCHRADGGSGKRRKWHAGGQYRHPADGRCRCGCGWERSRIHWRKYHSAPDGRGERRKRRHDCTNRNLSRYRVGRNRCGWGGDAGQEFRPGWSFRIGHARRDAPEQFDIAHRDSGDRIGRKSRRRPRAVRGVRGARRDSAIDGGEPGHHPDQLDSQRQRNDSVDGGSRRDDRQWAVAARMRDILFAEGAPSRNDLRGMTP
jgi:hypothetical protein